MSETFKTSIRDTMSAYARERYGLHEDWTWCKFRRGCGNDDELPDGLVRVTGAAYPVKERGKYKGKPDYKKPLPGTERTVFFTMDEFVAWQDDREQRLGICKECQGTGERIVSTGIDGTKYKPCTRCRCGLPTSASYSFRLTTGFQPSVPSYSERVDIPSAHSDVNAPP